MIVKTIMPGESKDLFKCFFERVSNYMGGLKLNEWAYSANVHTVMQGRLNTVYNGPRKPHWRVIAARRSAGVPWTAKLKPAK
jgi:hypothetical protein